MALVGWLAGLSLLVAGGCGRIGFDTATPCVTSTECASNQCVDRVCCDSECSGTCNECSSGTCRPVATMCSGDCATCAEIAGGFSCMPEPSACTARCSAASCTGADTAFSCDFTSCCATNAAPNFAGTCGMGVDVMVPAGCRFEYDYASCCTVVDYIEVQWDVEECMAGAWVSVDSGADAFSCNGCTHEIRNTWSDTCGNASAAACTQ